eukprot:1159891-Pelagomonas_calceolata.AAC.1
MNWETWQASASKSAIWRASAQGVLRGWHAGSQKAQGFIWGPRHAGRLNMQMRTILLYCFWGGGMGMLAAVRQSLAAFFLHPRSYRWRARRVRCWAQAFGSIFVAQGAHKQRDVCRWMYGCAWMHACRGMRSMFVA